MITSWLDRLVELVPPPPGFGGLEYDWAPTEGALGRGIPGTFKELVRVYGDVAFAAGYFSPRHPALAPEGDLLACTREYREILDIYEFPSPPEVLPDGVRIEPAELIKWGGSDTGEHYLWHTGNEDPEQWTIVLTDVEQQNWSFHHMSVTEFLLRWLTKDLVPPELHPGWERDVIFWGDTPSCHFYGLNSLGGVNMTVTVTLDVLADSVVLPWEERAQGKVDMNPLPEVVPEFVDIMAPPQPGLPPPSILPFPPRDLGKPVLDPAVYPAGYQPEMLTEVPVTGEPYLDSLLAGIPPIGGREPFDWAPTEQALGHTLPTEFTTFVDLWGDVFFGKVFRPYHPSSYPWVDLVTNTAKFREALTTQLAREWPAESVMAKIDLRPENTIAWGGADNGDHHLWHVNSDNPDEWTILLAGSHFHDWYSFTGSVPELIYRWMFNDLPNLPEYWSKQTRLQGQPMLAEFGPYHPNGTPLAAYEVTRGE